MHVLFLPSWYSTVDKPWRGTFFRDQALALTRSGVQVGMAFVERRSLRGLTPRSFSRSHFQITDIEEDSIPTMRMRGWSTLAQTTAGALLWARLTRQLVRRYVERHGVPDVIHAQAALWGGHAAMLCAGELRRPFVVTEHASAILNGTISGAMRRHAAKVYRNAAAVIAVGTALGSAIDTLAGQPVARIIPNAVDVEHFRMPPAPRVAEPFTFLAVGDLVHSKRFDALIRAFALLRMRRAGVRLVIIGSGKEAAHLRQLTSELDVGDVVLFTGALDRPHVRDWMWRSNALVMPSAFETFGVVLIEALATGIPVIATRCGGPEEIVRSEVGTLIERDDEPALLRALEQTMTRRFDSRRLHLYAKSSFGYPLVSQELLALYQRIVRPQPARATTPVHAWSA